MPEYARRTLLASTFPADRIHTCLLSGEQWRPFPPAADRAGWAALPVDLRRRLVDHATAYRGRPWPALPATLFLEYRRNGNRSHYEQPHFERRAMLAQLVLGECAEGEGRFFDDIVNGIWAICEESFWGVPAHSRSRRFPTSGLPDTGERIVDLFAAETGALLAWTHYLLGAQLAAELPVVTDRIVREVEERVLTPYRTVDDWGWLGKARRPVNNWNPWIHSNVLAANLLLETDATVREATVLRIIEGLDAFLDGYHDDGGCDEGPGYWGRAGASLFDCLELLHSASGGALDAYHQPLIQQIGRYIYRVHIGGSWFVNYADASAKVTLDAGLVYRYGQRIGDPALMAQGAAAFQGDAGYAVRGSSIARLLRNLFGYEELAAAARDAQPPLVREAWLDGIQVLAAREQAGTTAGLFVSAKGGHNAESHNHNDVGNFVVAVDGHPVLIDAGVETYTRRTFSSERYTIWTMQSQYHNLPVIDGHGQRAGREYAAREVSVSLAGDHAALTLDIAGAYPPEAGVRRWTRTVRLERGAAGARVVLAEDYALDHAPRSLALHLMASGEVDASQPGELRCPSPTRPLVVRYDAAVFAATVEAIPIEDARLRPVWGDHVYRVILAARAPAATGQWRLEMQISATE